jgi:hypothetical protein
MTTRKVTPALYRWRSKSFHPERHGQICLTQTRRGYDLTAKVRVKFPDGVEVEAQRTHLERAK